MTNRLHAAIVDSRVTREKGSGTVRPKPGIVMLLVLVSLAACASPSIHPTVTSTAHLVTFSVSRISIEPSGKTHIVLAVANSGPQELPADRFVAHLELTHADGRLCAAQDAVLPRIPPSTGDLTTVVSLHAPLEAGEYRLSWGASGLGSTLVLFEIEAKDGALRLGEQIVDHCGPGYPDPNSAAVQ